jgi:hypothetical protein
MDAGLAAAVAALGAFAVVLGARIVVLQWRERRGVPPKVPPSPRQTPRSLARVRAPEGGIGRPPTPEPRGVLVMPASVTGVAAQRDACEPAAPEGTSHHGTDRGAAVGNSGPAYKLLQWTQKKPRSGVIPPWQLFHFLKRFRLLRAS